MGQEEVVFQEQPVQRPRKGREQELNSIFKELKDAHGDGVEREMGIDSNGYTVSF